MKDKELQDIQKLLSYAQGHIKNINVVHKHEPINWSYANIPGTAMHHITTQAVNIVELECEMKALADIAKKFMEYEMLMSYPETRAMINEAKFLHHLKYGIKYEPL